MGKKLTQEEFIAEATRIHNGRYSYENTIYTKLTDKIIITCPIHGDFIQEARRHLNGSKCAKCISDSQRLTKDEFIAKSKEVHNNKFDYSKVVYINNNTPVEIHCHIHGSFMQRPANHMNGAGCPKCQRKGKHTKESFIKAAQKIHGDKYNYDKVVYLQNKSKVVITCPEHGDFLMKPNAHLSGQGCPKCGNVLRGKNKLKTTEQFIEEARIVHGDIYDYSLVNYTGKDNKVKIICKKHGIFLQTPHQHVTSKHGCPKCKLKHQFRIFKKLQDVFQTEVIVFEADVNTVPWLERQRLDIYFPKYNIAIEYDGPQHFMDFWLYYNKQGESLEITQKRDELKNQKCADNQCMLLRLRYDYSPADFDDIVIKIKERIKQWDSYTEKQVL